jgi:hypothetical protein
MSREPNLHLGMLVSCVVVDRGLNQLAWRNRPLDCLEEADELPTPVPLHATADHCASGTFSVASSVVVPWRL